MGAGIKQEMSLTYGVLDMDNTHRKIPKTWMIDTLPLIDMLVRIAKIESKNLDTNGFTVDEWAVQALLDAAAEIEEDIGFTTTSYMMGKEY